MSRALLRSVLELRSPIARLLPIRTTTPTTTASSVSAPAAVRFFNQTAQIIEPVHSDPSVVVNGSHTTSPGQQQQPSSSSSPSSSSPSPATHPPPSSSSPPQEPAATATTPNKPLSPSVRALLPLLAAQPRHYATIHIHGRPYLVTEGDSVRLPFRMPGVAPGDVLRLNRASVLGSRDFTLRGAPYVDERLFECRAVVTGTETEPLRLKVKKKRRCRRTKTVKSKHRFTTLRVSELKIRTDVVEEEVE
ncbi:hypothetical protein VTK26DRAFT_7024 [Humicola hyalothermophila]